MKKWLNILGVMILTTTISTNVIACDKLQVLPPTKASNWDKDNGAVTRLLNINNTIYVGTKTSEGKGKIQKQ